MNQTTVPVNRFNKTHSSQPSAVSAKIEISLLAHVFNQAKLGLMASLFCATLIFIGMYEPALKTRLYSWFGFFLFVTAARFTLVNFYMAAKEPEKRLKFWRTLFIVGALIGGISWGLVAILLYPYVTPLQQTLIVLIVAGISAGALPLLSAVLPAAVVFTVTAVAPLSYILFFVEPNYLFDVALLVYIAYMLVVAKNTHKMIVNSISLQFENHTLLNNLSHAKSQLELINQKLEQAASHDPLTNVANRNLFVSNFNEAISRAKQSKKILGLLFIDLDNFKTVNDVYGHHVGDQLLLILVDRIEQIVEDLDAISRLGGDEFTIILENNNTPQQIAETAKKIQETLSMPVVVNGVELKVSASIGISIYPLDGDDAEKLLTVADRAMYYVKEEGGNSFRFNVTLLTDK